MRLLLSTVFASFLLCSPAFAASITYTVNQNFPGLSAQGTITTDGNLGTLTSADILNYDLTVSTDLISASFTQGGSFPPAEVSGTDLTATASGLFYDFSGASSFFSLGAPGDTFLCFGNDGGCGAGSGTGVQIGISGIFADSPTQSGVEQIAATSAVPEPSSIALLALGLFGAAGAMRRRLV